MEEYERLLTPIWLQTFIQDRYGHLYYALKPFSSCAVSPTSFPGQVRSFVLRLKTDYYIDEDMIRDAIRRRASFNVIHQDTMLKVDIFIPKSRPFDQEELRRVQKEVLIAGTRPFNVASPEGVVLNKLEWYRMGGEVSDRQWNDILGVLEVQGIALDMNYLRRWAAALNVSDLLERALVTAGLEK